MTNERSGAIGLRRAPRQARSRARVDAAIAALLELVAASDHPTDLTMAEVAAHARMSVGTLYEYFEDVPAMVDTAMGRFLDRHDELLGDLVAHPPRTLRALVDALFDTYHRLYREEPGFLALRNSTLFQVRHRDWFAERVATLVRSMAASASAVGVFARRPDVAERLDFVFVIGDAVLQAATRPGAVGGEMMLEEGRAVVQYATRRLLAEDAGHP